MYRLLHAHVCKNAGNGPVAILAPGVRSAAGFDARRTIDAVSLGLWPSRGMLLTGYEIKVSRSDWLRELKNPAKAEEFASKVDRLVLVVSDADIVQDGELPENWGLLVRSGRGLKQVVNPTALHDHSNGRVRSLPPGFTRSFLVPLLRSANAVPPDVREELRQEAERASRYKLDEFERLKQRVAAFEREAGIKITEWSGDPEKAAERGRAFAVALEGEEQVRRLQGEARFIANAAERLRKSAEEIADPAERKAA